MNMMEKCIDSENIQQQYAFDMISKTGNSFFLTGRAGTGKTTFLKNVQSAVDKNFIVLAPTGVAAINAGGQTIHSFFGFSLGVMGPADMGNMNEEKNRIVRGADTIIIDEVSMVRCDIVDAMDRTLRACRRSSAPFGGVQMVFVGDPFQLEPVVTNEAREVLDQIYGVEKHHFFNSAVIRRYGLPKIEFLKVYRQTDANFVNLLEHVRTNRLTNDDLRLINRRFVSGKGDEEFRLTLTNTRAAAARINESRLAALEGDIYTFDASYQGDCSCCKDVADEQLSLKQGAQVMFTKNDPFGRWVNGTIGMVSQISEESIKVALEDGSEYGVEVETWESVSYKYDPSTKKTSKEVVGIVMQYPLRLAWAITIHKSQSLTFDHVAVDFGQRTFAAGQAYVALSRARSLDGLVLLSPFSRSSVMVSPEAVGFASDYNDERALSREIEAGEAVKQYLRAKDYDSASRGLFCIAARYVSEGDVNAAREFISRAMSFVADDDCLQGLGWEPCTFPGAEGMVVDAFGAFFSGDSERALDILGRMGEAIDRDFDALYLLSRCLEQKQDWKMVESAYLKMMRLYRDDFDKGLDSPSFRKFRYRLAILNERIYGDPGAGEMRMLIRENPGYGKYYEAMRWMLASNAEAVEAAGESDNDLVKAFFDVKMPDADVVRMILEAYAKSDDQWKGFRKYLNSIRLSMAC